MNSHSLSPQIAANEPFAFQKITKRAGIDTLVLNPLEIMESCEIVNVLETAFFDFPNFPEAKKKFHVIYFQLAPQYSSLKGLFNGLISIGQPNGVLLEIEKEKLTYSLKYYESDQEKINEYLNKIFRIVLEEIRFKSILKKIIQNQVVFAKEEQLLRSELFA
jgi:hypothetical protein